MTGITPTWLTGSVTLNHPVGTAFPQVLLTIPAGSRLDRIVVSPIMGGKQDFDTGIVGIGPVYYLGTIEIARPTTYNRTVWQARRVLQMNTVTLDDHLLLTKNRVYSAFHFGGDRELGDNLQMSWGGTGKPATNIRLTHGVFKIGTVGGTNFTVSGTVEVRALYHT